MTRYSVYIGSFELMYWDVDNYKVTIYHLGINEFSTVRELSSPLFF